MEVGEAVRAGRLHYEAETLHAEPGFSAESLDELERRGYRVVRWKGLNLYFGGSPGGAQGPGDGGDVGRRRPTPRRRGRGRRTRARPATAS